VSGALGVHVNGRIHAGASSAGVSGAPGVYANAAFTA